MGQWLVHGRWSAGDLQLTAAVMEDYERVLYFFSQGLSCLRCDYLSVKTDNKGRGGCASAFTDYEVVQKDKEKALKLLFFEPCRSVKKKIR